MASDSVLSCVWFLPHSLVSVRLAHVAAPISNLLLLLPCCINAPQLPAYFYIDGLGVVSSYRLSSSCFYTCSCACYSSPFKDLCYSLTTLVNDLFRGSSVFSSFCGACVWLRHNVCLHLHITEVWGKLQKESWVICENTTNLLPFNSRQLLRLALPGAVSW